MMNACIYLLQDNGNGCTHYLKKVVPGMGYFSQLALSLPVSEGNADHEIIIPVEFKISPNPADQQLTITDVTGNGFQ